ncbi:MAG: mismatch endonuclease Vsr, partial [Candidatus Nomurabacteria bacterium]|nr:mismatch endonuclease Vsr [Candidatus Nomurabacteria bacterium]
MGLIKGKNTKIELLVFKFLRQEEIYFQKHYGRIRGKPDIAIPRKKIAVLIDGDFWHGWKFHERKSKLNPYWLAKIEDNMRRDRKNVRFLRSRGWKVLRIWEH